MTWRIYYDDNTTFSDSDGTFEQAPCEGVLYILERHGDLTRIHSGKDYYAMIDGEIIAPEEIGPLLRKIGWLKLGRWTSQKRFEDIGRRVKEDAKG